VWGDGNLSFKNDLTNFEVTTWQRSGDLFSCRGRLWGRIVGTGGGGEVRTSFFSCGKKGILIVTGKGKRGPEAGG